MSDKKRRIRMWFHPSKEKGDYVSAGGWVVSGSEKEPADSAVSVSYRNTEVSINFTPDGVEVTTYNVKADGEIGKKIESKLFKYSDNKDKPDPPMERYSSHIDIDRVEKPFIKADMRHCVVFTTGKKDKKTSKSS